MQALVSRLRALPWPTPRTGAAADSMCFLASLRVLPRRATTLLAGFRAAASLADRFAGAGRAQCHQHVTCESVVAVYG